MSLNQGLSLNLWSLNRGSTVVIKVVGFSIKMSTKFVKLKLNFHAYDFFDIKVTQFSQLDGLATVADD